LSIDRPPAPVGCEFKHDGFRIMARRDGAGVGRISRQGKVGGMEAKGR
jgi:ATP-dependent DNA ligase